jgi:hypothetical protein
MTSTDAAADTRETVYAAIELSKKTWVLTLPRKSGHRVTRIWPLPVRG